MAPGLPAPRRRARGPTRPRDAGANPAHTKRPGGRDPRGAGAHLRDGTTSTGAVGARSPTTYFAASAASAAASASAMMGVRSSSVSPSA